MYKRSDKDTKGVKPRGKLDKISVDLYEEKSESDTEDTISDEENNKKDRQEELEKIAYNLSEEFENYRSVNGVNLGEKLNIEKIYNYIEYFFYTY